MPGGLLTNRQQTQTNIRNPCHLPPRLSVNKRHVRCSRVTGHKLLTVQASKSASQPVSNKCNSVICTTLSYNADKPPRLRKQAGPSSPCAPSGRNLDASLATRSGFHATQPSPREPVSSCFVQPHVLPGKINMQGEVHSSSTAQPLIT